MSGGIAYLQRVQALSASENTSGKMETNARKIQDGEQKRKELQRTIKEKQAEVEQLSKDIQEASDKNFLESFGDWLTGSDDVGELQDKMQTSAAEMKKAQHEVMVQQTKIEMMLQELQQAQADLGVRMNDRQKAYDENQRAGALTQS